MFISSSMWFLLAVFGYACLGTVGVIDKFILTKTVRAPALYTFYSTVFLLILFAINPFITTPLQGIDWLFAFLGGLAFGAGLLTLYVGAKKGEVTHLYPFQGAWITLILFAVSVLVFKESITPLQMGGIGVLCIGSLLLSHQSRLGWRGWQKGLGWIIISGVFFALFLSVGDYLYTQYPFWSAFLWLHAMEGICAVLVFFLPSVHQALRKPSSRARRSRAIGIVALDKVLGIIAVVCIQASLAFGNVALVGALAGVEYAVLFGIVYILTTWFPKILRERFTKGELVQQAAAIVLILIGSALIAF